MALSYHRHFELVAGLVLFLALSQVHAACQSCYFPVFHRHAHRHAPQSALTVALQWPYSPLHHAYFGLVVKNIQRKASIAGPVTVVVGVFAARKCVAALFRATEEASREDSSEHENEGVENSAAKGGNDDKPLTSAMVASIGFYKNFISPILPPACRFLPTCSQYGVQAIKEFGPTKGAVLTAWRIMRCSPLGGKGYDPPKWPPVHYTYGSY